MDATCHPFMNCSNPALPCPPRFEQAFLRSIERKVWRVDALLITEAILAVIIVSAAGAYGRRYRHHRLARFIFRGASRLFLPILSSVVSTISNSTTPIYVRRFNKAGQEDEAAGANQCDGLYALVATCDTKDASSVLIVWAFLIQIVMVNTSTIVAREGREGRSKGPPIDLILQGFWTIYLGVTFEGHDLVNEYFALFILLIAPFALLCAKIVLKYYAFQKARKSFALGRNPGLTFVYMEKLKIQEANEQTEPPVNINDQPPPLLVMGEDEKEVDIQPHGYAFKDDSGIALRNNIGLVTFDRVWQLDSMLPISNPQLKGLCLSFALFKLLRCRFSRYNKIGSMGTYTFIRSLSVQSDEHDRIFRIIADELSFVHDYYYSSLPIVYAKLCLPILNTLISLLSMGYCITLAVIVISSIKESEGVNDQIYCDIWWIHGHSAAYHTNYSTGKFLFDLLLLLFLPVLVLVVEVRDMVSYICSNWTKVSLICWYVKYTIPQRSLRVKKWIITFLLRCRCKLIMRQHWNEKMSQCSVLALHHQRTTLPAFVRRLLPLPDQKWKVKVTAAVKVCIINALRSAINGGLGKGVSSLHCNQVGESFLWACNGKGTSDTILVWHIATCIIQSRHRSGNASGSDHKTVATQLSQYCAYLVSWCPQLLPDNSAWSKGLYRAVKKDAEGALAGYSMAESFAPEDERALDEYSVASEAESSTAEDERALSKHPVADRSSRQEGGYQKLVRLLSENSKHEVVKDGVKLGKQLVETIQDQETVWKLLAEFWSEMILYLAPSDNLKGHSEAIARGGELITLLWALLFHAGIVSRPGDDYDSAAATSAGVV